MQINTVVCSDILQFIKDVDNNVFDLLVTSPPYQDLRKYGGLN